MQFCKRILFTLHCDNAKEGKLRNIEKQEISSEGDSITYGTCLHGMENAYFVRILDAVMHGCIPVVVSDDFQPPLDPILPWANLTVKKRVFAYS